MSLNGLARFWGARSGPYSRRGHERREDLLRTTTRLWAITVAVSALVVSGSAANAATEGSATEGSGGRQPSTITWAPCAQDATADCGTLSVPIDWSRPQGPKVDLALARRKATDPAARIGSLVVNPGGPGGSGVDFVLQGAAYFSDELRRHFDLVGFDPRGVARSHPVLCSAALLAQQPSPVLTSQADFDRAVAFNRQLGADCRRNTGPLMDHVDTLSVVHDIDAIRAAVGDEKLTYYGVSYGTLMGQQYAEEFPHHVRALTIDSNMDHSLGTAGFLYTEAGTAQDSFNEFVKGCGRDPRCSLFGRDIRALWADLLARAGRGELHDPRDPAATLAPLDLIGVAAGAFYGPAWFGLADLLATLDNQAQPAPKASGLTAPKASGLTAPKASGLTAPKASDLVEDGFQPVFCQDWSLPLRNYAEYAAHLAVQRLIAPDMRFSPLALSATVACLGWPAPVNNPQHPLRVHNSPTLLMLNSLHDPATAYTWALDAKAQLGAEARFVTYEGWGHGTYGRSDCLTGVVDAYLVSGALPPPGTRCSAVSPQPQAITGQNAGARPVPNGPHPAVPGW
jgi:pimeloyl-ACP methyl ester carboxylesterase